MTDTRTPTDASPRNTEPRAPFDAAAHGGGTVTPPALPGWHRWGLAGLGVVAVVLSVLAHHHLFPHFSGDADEVIYLFQSEMLRDGQFTVDTEVHSGVLRPWLSFEDGDRTYMVFQWGLPALLALSEVAFGSYRVILALFAALNVWAMYGFTREAFADRRIALAAAGLTAFTPIFAIQSGLVLGYLPGTAILFGAAWAMLAGARTGRPAGFALAGLGLGAASLLRPWDPLIFSVPLGILTFVRLRRAGPVTIPRLARAGSWAALGFLPMLAVTLYVNARTTGSPLAFPNTSDVRLNTFGWGEGRVRDGIRTLDYTFDDAVRTLGTNLRATPSWLFGGIILVVLAVWGLVTTPRRAERVAVLGMGLVFPIGYLFWSTTKLTGPGALNGIGPHYYVPMFGALTVLGAAGLVALPRRRLLLAPLLVVMVAATAWSLPDKIDGHRAWSAGPEHLARMVPEEGRALVFIRPEQEQPQFLYADWPSLRNPPDLAGRVLYALDHGGRGVALMEREGERAPYRLRTEYVAGDDLFAPTGGLRPLTGHTGSRLTITVELLEAPLHAHQRAYLAVAGSTDHDDRRILAEVPLEGGATLAAFTVASSAGVARPGDVVIAPGTFSILVGVEVSNVADDPDAALWEQRLELGSTADGGLAFVTPGLGWERAPFPERTVWLAIGEGRGVDVHAAPAPR